MALIPRIHNFFNFGLIKQREQENFSQKLTNINDKYIRKKMKKLQALFLSVLFLFSLSSFAYLQEEEQDYEFVLPEDEDFQMQLADWPADIGPEEDENSKKVKIIKPPEKDLGTDRVIEQIEGNED